MIRLMLISLLGIIVIYISTDNNKIKVVTEKVAIKNLPDSFDGFTILQLSDLHGKRFGDKQQKLLKKINNCNYDMIAITGDMMDNNNRDKKAFFELLDGIKNKDYLFCVRGNDDPPYYTNNTKKRTQIGVELEQKGCKLLESPYSIKRGDSTIWIFTLFNDSTLNSLPKNIPSGDTKIAISHYPLDQADYEDGQREGLPDCDLVLAGHYHGGQWRIPFIGALFVPDVNGHGLFPKQNTVSGLMEYGNYKQYITRGLGASGKYPLLRFRLFNTPEINLITLVKSK